MGPDQMSDYHESSEESEDIQEIRDSLALLEDLFVCDGDFKGGSERNGSDDGFWDNSDSESDSEFQGSLDSEEREILEDVDYLGSVRDGRLTSDGNT